jgi:hypothetical protein
LFKFSLGIDKNFSTYLGSLNWFPCFCLLSTVDPF